MMDREKYANINLEDLAADSHFREWVFRPTPGNEAFWLAFQEESPEKAALVAEARDLLLAVRQFFDSEPAGDETLTQYYAEVAERVRRRREALVTKRMRRRRMLGMTAAAAAAVLLLLYAGNLFFGWVQGYPSEYTTAYGERRVLDLPDGSVVHLNAGSRLVLGKNWKKGDREVWLEGEAYFMVEPKPATRAKFTVHTRGLDIEVLGTQFNVNTKREYTRIVLEEGKVRLLTQADNPERRQELIMAPGELADYFPETVRLTHRHPSKVEAYTSWREGYLVYDKATISEVIADIQSTYGLEVRITDTLLLQKTIRGALPTDDLDEFLHMVETLFNVKAIRSGNLVTLEQDDPVPE